MRVIVKFEGETLQEAVEAHHGSYRDVAHALKVTLKEEKDGTEFEIHIMERPKRDGWVIEASYKIENRKLFKFDDLDENNWVEVDG